MVDRPIMLGTGISKSKTQKGFIASALTVIGIYFLSSILTQDFTLTIFGFISFIFAFISIFSFLVFYKYKITSAMVGGFVAGFIGSILSMVVSTIQGISIPITTTIIGFTVVSFSWMLLSAFIYVITLLIIEKRNVSIKYNSSVFIVLFIVIISIAFIIASGIALPGVGFWSTGNFNHLDYWNNNEQFQIFGVGRDCSYMHNGGPDAMLLVVLSKERCDLITQFGLGSGSKIVYIDGGVVKQEIPISTWSCTSGISSGTGSTVWGMVFNGVWSGYTNTEGWSCTTQWHLYPPPAGTIKGQVDLTFIGVLFNLIGFK